MKKSLHFVVIVVLSLVMVTAAFAASSGKMDLKVGQEVYVCNCGPSCPCNTMSMREGNCTCGNKMVKAKVTKVEAGVAYVQAAGWENPTLSRPRGNICVPANPLASAAPSAKAPENVCAAKP